MSKKFVAFLSIDPKRGLACLTLSFIPPLLDMTAQGSISWALALMAGALLMVNSPLQWLFFGLTVSLVIPSTEFIAIVATGIILVNYKELMVTAILGVLLSLLSTLGVPLKAGIFLLIGGVVIYFLEEKVETL